MILNINELCILYVFSLDYNFYIYFENVLNYFVIYINLLYIFYIECNLYNGILMLYLKEIYFDMIMVLMKILKY